MSAPSVISVSPEDQATDVVLGDLLVVTFDQAMDTTTIGLDSFSLSCSAPTQVVTSAQLVAGDATPSVLIVRGTWSFATDGQGRTVATFTPEHHLHDNTLYTATLLGSSASLSTQDVMNPAGESMVDSFQWSFTTGVLNLKTPPSMSPLLDDAPAIQPELIKVLPRRRIGQDLTQQIVLIFPGEIDPTSVVPDDIYMSLEPLLGDPSVNIPADLVYTVVVDGNKLVFTITGFPS